MLLILIKLQRVSKMSKMRSSGTRRNLSDGIRENMIKMWEWRSLRRQVDNSSSYDVS